MESLIHPLSGPFGRRAAHPFRTVAEKLICGAEEALYLSPVAARSVPEFHAVKGGRKREVVPMSERTILVETILAGFFAVACIRASVPVAAGKLSFGNLLHLTGRIERLRRSRWQWFSMIALLFVIRMQMGVPIVLEAIVAIQFLLFLALPAATVAAQGARKG